MPSSQKARREIGSLIPKECKNIFEMGSGFGTLALALARRFPEKEVIAYEISWIPYFFSLILKKIFRIKNLTLKRKNFLHISLKEAECVVCYLCPKAMTRLKNKFKAELKASSTIVTHSFAIHEWKPVSVSILDDLWRTQIFLYRNFL